MAIKSGRLSSAWSITLSTESSKAAGGGRAEKSITWIGVVGGTKRRQSYLECNAHKTDGLGVEALVVQVCPEGHEGTLNAEMF